MVQRATREGEVEKSTPPRSWGWSVAHLEGPQGEVKARCRQCEQQDRGQVPLLGFRVECFWSSQAEAGEQGFGKLHGVLI